MLFSSYSVARIERGAGLVPVERIPYPVDQALERLKGFRQFVLVGAKAPVAFFAYPDKPSVVTPEGAVIHTLAQPEEDLVAALEALADAVGAVASSRWCSGRSGRSAPRGPITLPGIAATISALLPENVIVVDESITSGPRHPAGHARRAAA